MAERDPFEFAEKIFLYRTGKLDAAERDILEQQMAADPELKSLFDELHDLDRVQKELQDMAAFDTDKAYAEALDRVYPVKRLSRTHYGLIAASIALVVSLAVLFLFDASEHTQPEVLITQQDTVGGVQLLLATGERIRTDTITFLQTQEAAFAEEDGTLVVQPLATSHPTDMHKIIVPYRHTYQVTLPDGSKVFLNAGSTLSFPAAFQPDERRVQLDGEAIFEVAHMPHKPFFVETDQQQIRVLGTVFNVKAYANEPVHYTTLVKGSIALQHQGMQSELFLKPGHQVQYHKTTKKTTLIETNPAIATGWRDGWLAFDNTPMDEILRQIGRWYNLEVILIDQPLHDISASGKIMLYPHVNDVLRKFEKLGDIRFETIGNQVFAKHIQPNQKDQ